MTRDRGHRNSNERGSVLDRLNRKLFLLNEFGDGTSAPCAGCGEQVTLDTIYVNRIVPRHMGGRYTRKNIEPHCCACSCREGATLTNGKNYEVKDLHIAVLQ